MAYKWCGMRILKLDEVCQLHENGKLNGCYRLYPDGTEAEIDKITIDEIKEHYACGGGFGEELPTIDLELPDGKPIKAPIVVDISATSCLEEAEYELWNVLQQYMTLFGIRAEDDEPDWLMVKMVQEKIIDILDDIGVNFTR